MLMRSIIASSNVIATKTTFNISKKNKNVVYKFLHPVIILLNLIFK